MNTNSSTGGKLSVNVGKLERIASILAGTALLVKGLQNEEKKSGIAMAIAGGLLFFRGATVTALFTRLQERKSFQTL
jgi:uncharacterized membrane protein